MTKKTIKKTKTMTIEEHPQRTIPETFDLWDSDYISVNWEQQSQQSQRDKSARMLWFLRQKCAYVMIFATRMLWVLRQKCVHTLWFLQQKCAYVVSSTTTIVFLVFLVQTPVFPKVGLWTLCQIHQKKSWQGSLDKYFLSSHRSYNKYTNMVMPVYKYKQKQGHIFRKGRHSRRSKVRFWEGNFPPNYIISTLCT